MAILTMEEKLNVVIVGSGPAGLCAALWFTRLGIDFIVLEQRAEPLDFGRADGVQCRTVEVFESFGLAEELVRDAYWVNEVCFWAASAEDGAAIERIGRAGDVEVGISWRPHVILNQARFNEILIESMRKRGGREIEYGVTVTGVSVDSEGLDDAEAYPVTVTAEREGKPVVYKAKYALVSIAISVEGAETLNWPGSRRCAQRRAPQSRLQNGGRLERRRLGRHGRLRPDRLPRHPEEVHPPLARRKPSHHSPRGRHHGPVLHRVAARD